MFIFYDKRYKKWLFNDIKDFFVIETLRKTFNSCLSRRITCGLRAVRRVTHYRLIVSIIKSHCVNTFFNSTVQSSHCWNLSFEVQITHSFQIMVHWKCHSSSFCHKDIVIVSEEDTVSKRSNKCEVCRYHILIVNYRSS